MSKKKIITALSIVCILIFLFGGIRIQESILKAIYKIEYSEYVYTYSYEYSGEYEIDPLLILSIIKAESNFNENISSSSGAIGLMQLMESTANEMANDIEEKIDTEEKIYNPRLNIKLGISYYSYLLKHYKGNMNLSLAAYNAGIGNVDKWIKEGVIKEDGSNIENIPYKETNNYVRKILRDYKIYKKLYKKI